jgi:hypothetical protein
MKIRSVEASCSMWTDRQIDRQTGRKAGRQAGRYNEANTLFSQFRKVPKNACRSSCQVFFIIVRF